MLCSPRFADRTPAEVYATLPDEGTHLCSERPTYRILAETEAVRERRAQRGHPNHPKPDVVARAPNEVWSWDITPLPGPEKWRYFHLYVILDIFSRYVTGWMVAERETAGPAGHLVGETCLKHGVRPRELTLPLGPRVSHDGQVHGTAPGRPRRHAVAGPSPGLERQPLLGGAVRDRQIPPGFPGRLGSVEEPRDFCWKFFRWYNTDHRHRGIGLLTPARPRSESIAHSPSAPPMAQSRPTGGGMAH